MLGGTALFGQLVEVVVAVAQLEGGEGIADLCLAQVAGPVVAILRNSERPVRGADRVDAAAGSILCPIVPPFFGSCMRRALPSQSVFLYS